MAVLRVQGSKVEAPKARTGSGQEAVRGWARVLSIALLLTMGQCATGASALWAQESGDPHAMPRGDGMYLSITLLVFWLFVFFAWVRTTDWVNADTAKVALPRDTWTHAVFFGFLGGLVVALLLPLWYLSIVVLLLAYFVPLGVYIKKRNALVQDADKVLTKDHLRYMASHMGETIGLKIEAEKKAAHELGPDVDFKPRGAADDQANQANLIVARQSPGYVPAKELVAEASSKRAEKIMLEYSRESVAVKFEIDGVWHDSQAREREAADPILAVFKKLANLKPEERRARQQGEFAAQYNGSKYQCTLASQGVPTGERAVLQLATKSASLDKLDDVGMREKMQAQLKEMLGGNTGFIVFSSLPGGGLSTTLHCALNSTDRLMRDFVAIEDKKSQELDIENVEIVTADYAGGETPDKLLPKIILKQPEVFIVPEAPNAETVRILCEQVNEQEKLAVSTVRAKEAVEALLRILATKVPPKDFARAITAVVNQRLVRKLCDACKEPYEPSPDLLKRLGIPPGRVERFYRERQPLPPDSNEKREPCKECAEIGYKGRTAVFELLVINDQLRQALVKQPKLEVLRQVARKSGHKSLQEEGILLVAKGVTSLTELQRALKQ